MPQDEDKDFFQVALTDYLVNLKERHLESEEHQKNLLIDFLKKAVFPNNDINTKERADLVVLNGSSSDSPIAILFETKSTTNSNEMPRENNMNTKGFQEIVSYYLRERVIHENIEIKKCIITNGLSWYVFDANEFEKHFYQNKTLVDYYQKFTLDQLTGHTTDFLYREIIAPAIDKAISDGINVTHFDLRDFTKKGQGLEFNKRATTTLYRFFTPENLLKKEIFVDSNKLNKNFYDELLHLMGLEEVKLENKVVIQRVSPSKRQNGSLIENTMNRISMRIDLDEDEIFDVAMQLCVVWINRILFLKLLESQLIAFNNNDESFRFLTKDRISSFEDLYDLFFGVLGRPTTERIEEMKLKYEKIPYLNSSLFEEMELEGKYLRIDSLREEAISVFSRTKLRDTNNKKKVGRLDFLTYLFEFLNSYDFSTATRHRKDVKNELINASVLGLIFEKINGYKDGSYYTPGKITMFMAERAIRKAVINKFNSTYDWNIKKIEDIEFKIHTIEDAKRANEVINSLRICDPAVGSGHFLVSALNEIIAIKSQLGVLLDDKGRSLNNYHCEVINDELIVQDISGDNFIYKVNNVERTRVQRAIFNEKRTLIENCLFGVDVNPNSVNICRLRLWIELLKSSYYEVDESTQENELVTLPNIDINIKVGDSLLHKLPVDLPPKSKFGSHYTKYFDAVTEYKREHDKSKKAEITREINQLKLSFHKGFNTPEQRKVGRLRSKLNELNQLTLFKESKEEKSKRKKEISKTKRSLTKAIKEMEEADKNPLWNSALEWRLEFPEILDDESNYIGFDLIIANPPYIYSSNESFSKEEKHYFTQNYPLSNYQANTFGLFLELSLRLLNENGHISFIIPNSFLTVKQYEEMREYLINNTSDLFILNSKDRIFGDANIDNCIIDFTVSTPTIVKLAELKNGDINEIATVEPEYFKDKKIIGMSALKRSANEEEVNNIISLIDKNSKHLEPHYGLVRDGLKAYERGKGTPKQPTDREEFDLFVNNKTFFSPEKEDLDYRPFLSGREINRYTINWNGMECI